MSWSGFKKNVGRATTQVMMKTGQVERTADREYEVEERRYRVLESASLRLQKEAKGYLDSLRAMTASQMRIAETIDAFYGDSGAKDGVSRSYKQAVEDLDAETVKALDGPYRTTVLEPINRFCAYFPDINECIKKRNHKMLDYDAMRSKVKKLTEKPDKDPNKLPRTEKELEMVSMHDFLSQHPSMPAFRESSVSPHHKAAGTGTLSDKFDCEVDLNVPSPPKALQRPEIERLRSQEPYARPAPAGLGRSPSVLDRLARFKPTTTSTTSVCGEPTPRKPTRNDVEEFFNRNSIFITGKSVELQQLDSSAATLVTSFSSSQIDLLKRPSARAPSPFFQPSELEEIMAPVKQHFMQRQADEIAQAKAGYEQLNEQLTTELPQLIDLRVPYLDPSFEALVKIQLRFCAEAYSRMAQVQQYLDASTRDQYASGDLDARVEDVLGQIRELSIAGTV